MRHTRPVLFGSSNLITWLQSFEAAAFLLGSNNSSSLTSFPANNMFLSIALRGRRFSVSSSIVHFCHSRVPNFSLHSSHVTSSAGLASLTGDGVTESRCPSMLTSCAAFCAKKVQLAQNNRPSRADEPRLPTESLCGGRTTQLENGTVGIGVPCWIANSVLSEVLSASSPDETGDSLWFSRGFYNRSFGQSD